MAQKSGKTAVGLRALTMQQPFAAAMAQGLGLYSRRGKPAKFHVGKQPEWKGSTRAGEWVAVHCGQNDEHLKNASLMQAVRSHWPTCPSDEELRRQQRCILGVVHFVDGNLPATSGAAAADFFLSRYTCTKTVAWRGDQARPCLSPLPYPKGNLQIWQVHREGFVGGADAEHELLALIGSPAAAGGDDASDDDSSSGGTTGGQASALRSEKTLKQGKRAAGRSVAATRAPLADAWPAKRTKRESRQ